MNTFTGKSIDADQWKDHLYDYFRRNNPGKVKLLDTVDWQACIVFIVASNEAHVSAMVRLGSTAKEKSFLSKWNMTRRLRHRLMILPQSGRPQAIPLCPRFLSMPRILHNLTPTRKVNHRQALQALFPFCISDFFTFFASCISRAAPVAVTVTLHSRASPYLHIFVQYIHQL